MIRLIVFFIFTLLVNGSIEATGLGEGRRANPKEQGISSDVIEKAQNAFRPDGFKPYGTYRWSNPMCRPYDYSVGRCVGLYKDDRLSIYPVKDVAPGGDYGHALIHGVVKFNKNDIKSGERYKWVGSTKYREKYSLKEGYLFLPKSSFPPHILFSEDCRSIRIKLVKETATIVQGVTSSLKPTGKIIVEYPIGYDTWFSREPFIIQSMCNVVSRSYRGKYQPYLGPLKR